jgi:hypothetical protein
MELCCRFQPSHAMGFRSVVARPGCGLARADGVHSRALLTASLTLPDSNMFALSPDAAGVRGDVRPCTHQFDGGEVRRELLCTEAKHRQFSGYSCSATGAIILSRCLGQAQEIGCGKNRPRGCLRAARASGADAGGSVTAEFCVGQASFWRVVAVARTAGGRAGCMPRYATGRKLQTFLQERVHLAKSSWCQSASKIDQPYCLT